MIGEPKTASRGSWLVRSWVGWEGLRVPLLIDTYTETGDLDEGTEPVVASECYLIPVWGYVVSLCGDLLLPHQQWPVVGWKPFVISLAGWRARAIAERLELAFDIGDVGIYAAAFPGDPWRDIPSCGRGWWAESGMEFRVALLRDFADLAAATTGRLLIAE